MVEPNRMRLGRFEFIIDFGSFRRITACWSGPGWDINFSGACINDTPEDPFFDGRIGVYCDAAPLPFAKAADYTGVEVDLPGFYEEASGEPYFAVTSGRATRSRTHGCGLRRETGNDISSIFPAPFPRQSLVTLSDSSCRRGRMSCRIIRTCLATMPN